MASDHRGSPRFVAASLVALGVALTSPAFAQSAGEKETARSLLKDGDAAMAKGDVAKALESFSAAHAIMKVPITGLAVARAAEASGKLIEAREAALAVARLPVAPDEPDQFKQARTDAAALAASLADKIPAIRVAPEGVPSGTELRVKVDGVALPAGASTVAWKVNPGKHVVIVGAAGFRDETSEVTVALGEQKSVAIKLTPQAPAAPGPEPATPPPGQTPPGPPPDAPPPSGTSPLVFVGFGVGVVGLGVGAVTGGMSLSKTSELEDQCAGGRCAPALQGDYDSARTLATVSNIGFVVGGIGVATGVIALLVGGPAAKASASAKVTPWVGPGSVGARGRF